MPDMTRRSFLAKGSIGAVTAAGVISAPTAAAAALRGDGAVDLTEEEMNVLAQPFVVHLRDARTGELELLVGEQSILFTNKALVAKVLKAAR